jgi:hypothetical protein
LRASCNLVVFALAGMLGAACGCGSDMPFELLPVHGKVTYDDGSLIKAGSILVTFNPVGGERQGAMTTPGGQAKVNVADGTFAAVSTRRPDDGLAAGRHKVVVVSFEPGGDGMPKPSAAVPPQYRKVTTTPLEVDVNSADQLIEIKVSKK